MFRASSVPIIRSYPLYTRQLSCFMQVLWPLPSSQVGTAFQFDSARKRFYDKIKFWIFDSSSWLFHTKLVTMHGHLNIKTKYHIELLQLYCCRKDVPAFPDDHICAAHWIFMNYLHTQQKINAWCQCRPILFYFYIFSATCYWAPCYEMSDEPTDRFLYTA
jgi:hypothetical protein